MSSGTDTAPSEPSGPPMSMFLWRDQWSDMFPVTSTTTPPPPRLSECFWEKVAGKKKTLSGSKFTTRAALALRCFWDYQRTDVLESPLEDLLRRSIITEEDIDFMKEFLDSACLTSTARVYKKEIGGELVKTVNEMPANPPKKKEALEEVLQSIRLFEKSPPGAPLGDSYKKSGLIIHRFLAAINEEKDGGDAVKLGLVTGMTADAFLGGFRASVTHYTQIVNDGPANYNKRRAKAINRRKAKKHEYKPEDETTVTVFFAGLVNNIQSRINDCAAESNLANVLDVARDSGQTRPARLNFRFGPDKDTCKKTAGLNWAGYDSAVDSYVTMLGARDPLDLADKYQSPLMVEVKAAGWKPYVWRQLTAEMAAWIFQTMKPDDSAQVAEGALHHKVLFTQHGAELYIVIAAFDNDYLKYLHQDFDKKDDVVLSADLEADMALYDVKKGKSTSPPIDSIVPGMLQMTRWGPFRMDDNPDMEMFVSILIVILQARRREHEAQVGTSKKAKK